MTRYRIAAGLIGTPAVLAIAAVWLVFFAPVYQLMPHQPRDTSALFSQRPVAVAHRGWSGVAPENTLAAFEAAGRGGYWVELDVTLAASGEIVVIHDDTVDRTTNGSGEVSRMSWEDLSDLDAGSWYGPEFAGQRLPTLAEAFEVIPRTSVVLVEMKTQDDKKALPKAVAAAIKEASRTDRVMVISFDPFLLESLRLEAPEIFRGQLVGDYEDSDLAFYEKRALQNLAFTDAVQQDAVLWQHDLLEPGLVGQMKAHGYPVFAWTANEPADIARMKELGIDGIISNHPDRVHPDRVGQ